MWMGGTRVVLTDVTCKEEMQAKEKQNCKYHRINQRPQGKRWVY